ncbi:hypothetical protein [Devosia sp. FKR38]|uniref:hypothetical protein n=1 Tax=Devosia sp. FKR38 TaxID=2562312 RepID=UPI0010C08F55|nr:hypothetical protein [Devosia sp. FKR38]
MKLLPVLALLPLFIAPAPFAHAQSPVSQCTAIAGDAERLACYDGLFRTPALASEGISAVLQSEQLIPARPSGRAPATMTVTCVADTLSVAFAFANNTMSALGHDAGITLQNDLQAARSRTLPVNADNTAVLINNSADAATFLDGLAGVTNLTARVTPANSRSLSVRFRVDGFLPEIGRIRAACDR